MVRLRPRLLCSPRDGQGDFEGPRPRLPDQWTFRPGNHLALMSEIDAATDTEASDPGQPEPPDPSAPTSGRRRWIIEWVGILVFAVTCTLLLRNFVVEPYKIPSPSMEPTLMVHDKLLVDKLSYSLHAVHRGDIAVFHKPADFVDPGVTVLIKRVIGLPGETISLQRGQIYINGKVLDQKWLPAEGITNPGPPITNQGCANTGPQVDYCVIPKGEYYMMGDNRSDSDDSRVFGPVPRKVFIGRAFLIVWPPSHIGTL